MKPKKKKNQMKDVQDNQKPTMGESIAAAEAKAEALGKAADPAFEADTPLTRDPSLVTTGDYTNFEVDTPKKEIPCQKISILLVLLLPPIIFVQFLVLVLQQEMQVQ